MVAFLVVGRATHGACSITIPRTPSLERGDESAGEQAAAGHLSTDDPTAYVGALTARLAAEYGDAPLAQHVVAGLDTRLLARLEAVVPLAEVATSARLAYDPSRCTAHDVDTVLAFAFGNRVHPDGTITPGPTNEALAEALARFLARYPVPVFAQHEIAGLLEPTDVAPVTSIDPVVDPDGGLVYLSTAGVAQAMVDQAARAGIAPGVVGVVAFADHAVRCVLTARATGLDAGVLAGIDLPRAYDAESGQPWTRDRPSYLAADLLGRIATH